MKPDIRIYIRPCSDIINIAGFGITHCDTATAFKTAATAK